MKKSQNILSKNVFFFKLMIVANDCLPWSLIALIFNLTSSLPEIPCWSKLFIHLA